ncbi:MAG: type IV pilus assembly protein PilM [Planctomycetota bacterium]|jgi:type IV pilus assembly protein PilM
MNLRGKFLFKLGFEKKEVMGLDIGSSQVKLIQLRKGNGGYAVTAAGITEIAASEGSNKRRRINTLSAIHQCLESTGIKTDLTVCGVNGPEVAVRHFEFPPLPSEEIEAAVSLEASQVCPFNAGDGAIDYQLMPDGDDKTRGVLVAATNALIKSKVQLAKEAHLKCVLMDVDGLALLNCFNELGGESEEPQTRRMIAILNIGGTCTTLAIMGDNGWPFIRDMPHAGDDIVKQLAIENDLSIEAAKEMLSSDSPAEQIEHYDSLKSACQKLIVDVAESLRYYVAQEKSTLVDKIFVCGGFAPAKGFVELLNSQLPVEAVLWNPFDKIRCDAGQRYKDILAKTGPAMAVAAGLAMRSI